MTKVHGLHSLPGVAPTSPAPLHSDMGLSLGPSQGKRIPELLAVPAIDSPTSLDLI